MLMMAMLITTSMMMQIVSRVNFVLNDFIFQSPP